MENLVGNQAVDRLNLRIAPLTLRYQFHFFIPVCFQPSRFSFLPPIALAVNFPRVDNQIA